MTQVYPHIMFQGQLKDALTLWTQAFGPLDVDVSARDDQGNTVQAMLTLHGQTLSLFDSPPVHDFDFTPSISLMVRCETANEVDQIAAALGAEGETLMPPDSYHYSKRFTWLKDKFGVSWQIMVAT